MASPACAMTSSSPSDGSRLAVPAASDSPHTSFAFSGRKKIGSQPSAISALIATFFGPIAAITIGMRSRTGRLISFSGLPSPVPCSAGSGIL
jgi:hypothetical protein